MEAIQVDPRVIAEALHISTEELARILTEWASNEVPMIEFDRTSWSPTPLEDFDERVARARRYLEDAHEAMRAWSEDNPPDEDDDPA